MDILFKKEIYVYENEIELLKIYIKNNSNLLKKEEEKELSENLDNLQLIHHHSQNFRMNFDQLFSRLEKGIFDKEETMRVQGIEKGMGTYLCAIPIHSQLHFFVMEGEFGINILINPKEMNTENIKVILETVEWFKIALENPIVGEKIMKDIQLRNKLNHHLAINEQIENKMKL